LEDGLVNGNPAARPGRFLKTKKDRKKEVNPFTREEVALMLDTAREYFPRYFPLLLCAARSRLRLGEILALQWGDLDLDSRFIEVKRNYTHGKVVTPKSDEMGRVDMASSSHTRFCY
jgi:integrase